MSGSSLFCVGSLGLGDGGDSQVELAGSVVGSGAEVDEVFESTSHALGELDRPIDGLELLHYFRGLSSS
jgi:hypothetical protein